MDQKWTFMKPFPSLFVENLRNQRLRGWNFFPWSRSLLSDFVICHTCRGRWRPDHTCLPRRETGRRVTETAARRWEEKNRDPKFLGDRLADGFAWMEGEEARDYDDYGDPVPGGYYDS